MLQQMTNTVVVVEQGHSTYSPLHHADMLACNNLSAAAAAAATLLFVLSIPVDFC
jgi:hypothetical protein